MAWALLSGLMLAWAIATPLSAAPDEPAHIIKAASVVRGQLVGVPSSEGHIVTVPEYIAFSHEQACFIFLPDVTADCADKPPVNEAAIVEATTTAGLYNPAYYALVGWPSLLLPDSSGIYAMRAVSAIISALFLALSVTLIASWKHRRLPLISCAIAATPMLVFLGGTVNPNSMEAVTVLAAFVAMMTLVTGAPRKSLNPVVPILVVSSVLAANARGLSPLWLTIGVLVPLMLISRGRLGVLLRSTSIRVGIAIIAVGTVAAMIWLLTSKSLGGIPVDDVAVPYPYVGASPILGFLLTLEGTFSYAAGLVGIFGWLDTPAPAAVYFIWAALCGSLLLAAFSVLKGAKLRTASALLACTLFVPAIIQGLYVQQGGLIWQGRYALPIFLCLVIGLAALLSSYFDHLPVVTANRMSVSVWSAWAVAQTYCFAVALHRYAVGYSAGWGDLFSQSKWSPPGGVLTVLCTAIFFAGTIATLAYRATRTTQKTQTTQTTRTTPPSI
ncbi:DUF2142 domain-containing protein [Cryobacterium serini]|uniref:DUF2142 domain-containing protein n=1 Tax=Cryobacterium serini TaxID=1259201 RepID=A0A4R9BLB3_9MICO|nr:DUF2142 domain-containing protein [Cryobacterium serini]TFD86276.1 DUF2142 domain-containing protein [Cryobacterium serini]